MAKIFRLPGGYLFAGLSTTGMRLVNEFQRYHPHLCKPCLQPEVRFIRAGSPEQKQRLEKLVASVLASDPEAQQKPKPLSKARA